MAKLADATDLKFVGSREPCGFKSRPGHQPSVFHGPCRPKPATPVKAADECRAGAVAAGTRTKLAPGGDVAHRLRRNPSGAKRESGAAGLAGPSGPRKESSAVWEPPGGRAVPWRTARGQAEAGRAGRVIGRRMKTGGSCCRPGRSSRRGRASRPPRRCGALPSCGGGGQAAAGLAAVSRDGPRRRQAGAASAIRAGAVCEARTIHI